jgi:hypothetical protein
MARAPVLCELKDGVSNPPAYSFDIYLTSPDMYIRLNGMGVSPEAV